MRADRAFINGIPVSLSRTRQETIGRFRAMLRSPDPALITFVNPYSFYVGRRHQAFVSALWHFDLVLADGIGVVKAIRWLRGEHIERQSFDQSSLFQPVLDVLEEQEASLCIIGGRPGVAALAEQRLKEAFPSVRYLGCMDGFQSFDDLSEWVVARQPDVVLVGMGACNQESLLVRLKQNGFGGIGITCGGFLDQFIAKQGPYYPSIVDRLNLRWLYRWYREPTRLTKRYLFQYRVFIMMTLSLLMSNLLRKEA